MVAKLAPAIRAVGAIALTPRLGGCVDYQVGIQSDSQTHGTLVQTLHLDDQFVALNSEARQQWLQIFIQEANAFSGKVSALDDGTLQVCIDFYNGDDLVQKFNQLFAKDGLMTQVPGAPPLRAHLELTQRNWGVALRNYLHADIDLNALTADSTLGDGGVLDRWRILDLSFQVGSMGSPRQWPLLPGQLNTIDTVFWVPSPVGIGAAVIVLLCAIGYGVRYGLLPQSFNK